MPTYDYRCEACGHAFDAFQSIKADPLTDCPSCHKSSLRRVIGAGGGLIFKGSGFYITDYTRSKDYKEKAKSDTGAPAASTSAPAATGAPATAASAPASSGGGGGAASAAKTTAAA